MKFTILSSLLALALVSSSSSTAVYADPSSVSKAPVDLSKCAITPMPVGTVTLSNNSCVSSPSLSVSPSPPSFSSSLGCQIALFVMSRCPDAFTCEDTFSKVCKSFG